MPMKRRSDNYRFNLGDWVFLRPVRHVWLEQPFQVTGYLQHNGWPHYELRAPDGSIWQASQLDLSSTRVSFA